MRRTRYAAVGALLAACTGRGSFEVVLTMPGDPALQPNGATTVTLVLTEPGAPSTATTSVLADGRFDTGDIALGNDVRVEAQLRDVSNRLVGLGVASATVDIRADEDTTVEVPVRRPFVYASDGASLFSFDLSADSAGSSFQGQLVGVAAPQLVVSIDGERLAIVGRDDVSIIATDTHRPAGTPIRLPGMARDAAAVPGTAKLAIAHDQGIAIVDVDAGTVDDAPVGPVDRVTVGASQDGRLLAHGLVGRLRPEINPFADCSGSSMLVTIDVGAPQATTARVLGEPVSDLAAAAETFELFATLPCSGRVVKLADPLAATPSFLDVAPLERASVLVVTGGRIFAAGTVPSVARCSNPATCQPNASTSCPQPGAPPPNAVQFVLEGARIVVLSIPLTGEAPVRFDLPERRQSLLDDDDPAGQHAQSLHAFGTVPLDLVALPGNQFVGVIASSNYYIEELAAGTGVVVLPCLDAATSDWLLLDLSSGAVAQRVRTSCQVVVGPADIFPRWSCEVLPPAEQSAFGDYTPLSVGALFGAR